jgi:ADP-ribose pyrophosphatase YjhB (NUDIX family)
MKDAHCSHCGTAFAPPLAYPRRCANAACGVEVWSNPVPVSVVLVPVESEAGTGLLVVRRGIEPGKGKLALPGGFAEDHETWQAAGARELKEEAQVEIDPRGIECLWFASTEPRPNRVLLFGVAAPVRAADLTPFRAHSEISERGAVFGPAGLADVFAFPLHRQAAEKWFAGRGAKSAHGFRAL